MNVCSSVCFSLAVVTYALDFWVAFASLHSTTYVASGDSSNIGSYKNASPGGVSLMYNLSEPAGSEDRLWAAGSEIEPTSLLF